MSVGMTMLGVKEAVAALKARQRRIGSNLHEALKDAGGLVLAAADYYVPVDTGYLKFSGASYVEGSMFNTVVTVGYGVVYPVYYALWVHEITHYFHEPPTRSHYLVSALFENQDVIVEMVKRRAKE